MKSRRLMITCLMLALLAGMLLAGCDNTAEPTPAQEVVAEAATATPVPPVDTATPVPPTATPVPPTATATPEPPPPHRNHRHQRRQRFRPLPPQLLHPTSPLRHQGLNSPARRPLPRAT